MFTPGGMTTVRSTVRPSPQLGLQVLAVLRGPAREHVAGKLTEHPFEAPLSGHDVHGPKSQAQIRHGSGVSIANGDNDSAAPCEPQDEGLGAVRHVECELLISGVIPLDLRPYGIPRSEPKALQHEPPVLVREHRIARFALANPRIVDFMERGESAGPRTHVRADQGMSIASVDDAAFHTRTGDRTTSKDSLAPASRDTTIPVRLASYPALAAPTNTVGCRIPSNRTLPSRSLVIDSERISSFSARMSVTSARASGFLIQPSTRTSKVAGDQRATADSFASLPSPHALPPPPQVSPAAGG